MLIFYLGRREYSRSTCDVLSLPSDEYSRTEHARIVLGRRHIPCWERDPAERELGGQVEATYGRRMHKAWARIEWITTRSL
jgi:hypothetical protein